MFINEATRSFIRQHQDEDVRKLALQGTKDAAVDLPMALQQIAGRQTALKKLPSWAATEDIVYPPHLNMEQCSSEQTARYKAKVVQQLVGSEPSDKGRFVDLTGGFGVDFYWMSQGFQQRNYVEQNDELCAISSENFHTLGLDCTVLCGSAAEHLVAMPPADVIYLDPARRNEHGGRTYSIEDCTPNVLELLPLLMEKARFVVIKLSPMLDWRKAVEDIRQSRDNSQKSIANVSEVHIISVDNECKELLLVLCHKQTESIKVVCVNDDTVFLAVPTVGTHSTSRWYDEYQALVRTVPTIGTNLALPSENASEMASTAFSYLYEPNASIMKAGCFKELEQQFPVLQISDNSHLFVAANEIDDFPGRKFQITAISSMNKQELRNTLKDIRQANITVRNFPLTVDQLRKKLKLKDGGNCFIFATTMADGQHKLLICRKIG